MRAIAKQSLVTYREWRLLRSYLTRNNGLVRLRIVALNTKTNRLYRLPCVVGILSFFVSCQFNSDMQSEGKPELHGVWRQDSVYMQDQSLQYTLHEFKFVCDSMYVTMHTTSKVKNIHDTCYNDGKWTEYAKAVYLVRGDSILADGQYNKANWTQKLTGCYRIGQYLPRFKIQKVTADSLILESRFDQRPIALRKIADITCVPKKRWE